MAPDINVSSTSLEFVRDAASDSASHSSASYTSSEDLHIGFSPRPKLPFGFDRGVGSNVWPSRPTGNSASRAPRPAHPLSFPTFQRPGNQLQSPERSGPSSGGGKCGSQDGDQAFVGAAPRGSGRFRRLSGRRGGSRERRSSLLALFNGFGSKWAETRILRETRDKADREFMAAARALVSECPQLQRLQQLHDSMRWAHLQYQEAEEQLDVVVDKLRYGREETEPEPGSESHSELEPRKESVDRMAEHAWRSTSSKAGSDGEGQVDIADDITLRGITGDRPEAIFPLYRKMTAAFAQLQLARELLINTRLQRDWMHARREQPVEEETMELLESYGEAGKRKALELREWTVMTEEEKKELELYDELEGTAQEKIAFYTTEFKLLRQACKENGEMPSYSSFKDDAFGFESFARDEILLPQSAPRPIDGPRALAHPFFPLLLYNSTHVLYDFPLTLLESLRIAIRLGDTKQVEEFAHQANMHSLLSAVESSNTNESVNRWLLHKLFHSAMEVELLWTVFQTRLVIFDLEHWQRDVLYYWWRDETADTALVADDGSQSGRMTEDEGEYKDEDEDEESSTDFGAMFKSIPYSESGQLEGIRHWTLTDAWPDSD